jgi:hypothetical protein
MRLLSHKMRLLSLFLVLRRSPAEVIAVTEVIGYRSRPKKRATRIDSKVSLICALVPNADRQDETVDAKADSRSKMRGDNPL